MKTKDKTINLIIVDGHPVVRSGIGAIFSKNGFTMVGGADNLEQTFNLLADHPETDVLILELDLPGASGISFLKRVKEEYPRLPILFLSAKPEIMFAPTCMISGASGYIEKSACVEELIRAVRVVAAGQIYTSESIKAMMITRKNSLTRESRKMVKRLSVRETEILNMVLEGKRNKAIGEELDINEKTVSTYKSRLFHKLHVSTTVELVNTVNFNRIQGQNVN